MERIELCKTLKDLSKKVDALNKLEGYENLLESTDLKVVEEFPSQYYVINNETHLEALINHFSDKEQYELASRTKKCIEQLIENGEFRGWKKP